MKRLFAMILVLTLVFALCACGKEQDSPASTPAPADPETFTPPENYASVVLVSINPQFRLYLDAEDNVLAVEPVNDDAKTIAGKVTTGNIETVIEKIVTASKDGGFVTESATVDIEITEIKADTVNPETLLEKAESSAVDSFQKLEIEAEVSTSVSPEASTPPALPQPPHSHVYADATCTLPATCDCGATEGEALGHSYKSGVCTVCGENDPDFSYTAVAKKGGKWKVTLASDAAAYKTTFILSGASGHSVTASVGDPLSSFPEEMQEDVKVDCEKINGNYYFFGKGDGDDLTVTEKDDTVTLTDSSGNTLTLKRTDENTLTVTASSDEFAFLGKVPTGTKLAFAAA